MVGSKVDDMVFLGQFTARIDINKKIHYVNFYVQDCCSKYIIFNQKMAIKRGLVQKTAEID